MRPVLLVPAALVAASLASPAAAAPGVCTARADEPAILGGMVLGTGAFTCDGPRPGMTVTVCVEAFSPLETVGWVVEECETDSAALAASVETTAYACVMRTVPVLVRTAAKGWNADGNAATATSAPAWAPGFGSCGP